MKLSEIVWQIVTDKDFPQDSISVVQIVRLDSELRQKIRRPNYETVVEVTRGVRHEWPSAEHFNMCVCVYI
jgi:hypothetical protein